jgi:bifunctional DNA-binding transcriptional regulator/antitoxin component of YhaV-PrlF toxin-antitoxin module
MISILANLAIMISMEIIQSDAAGKIRIPEKVFHALGIKPGAKLRIETKGHEIILSKLDDSPIPILEEENYEIMKLSEDCLHDFLSNEPDLYSESDLKVKYT